MFSSSFPSLSSSAFPHLNFLIFHVPLTISLSLYSLSSLLLFFSVSLPSLSSSLSLYLSILFFINYFLVLFSFFLTLSFFHFCFLVFSFSFLPCFFAFLSWHEQLEIFQFERFFHQSFLFFGFLVFAAVMLAIGELSMDEVKFVVPIKFTICSGPFLAIRWNHDFRCIKQETQKMETDNFLLLSSAVPVPFVLKNRSSGEPPQWKLAITKANVSIPSNPSGPPEQMLKQTSLVMMTLKISTWNSTRGIYIYIYIYVCAVKLLSGPSLAFEGSLSGPRWVSIWSKFVFAQKRVSDGFFAQLSFCVSCLCLIIWQFSKNSIFSKKVQKLGFSIFCV